MKNHQKICLKELLDKDPFDDRIELDPIFKKEILTKLLKRFGWKKLIKELKISRSMLYHYKNNRVNNLSLNQLIKCLGLLGLNIDQIEDKIENSFSRKEQVNTELNLGVKLRHKKLKEYRKQIPQIPELVNNNTINFEKWLGNYINLIDFGTRQITNVKKEKNQIILEYTNHVNSRKKTFQNCFPRKIKIDEDFEYFFGLWCGDRVGRGRFGVVNKEKAINLATHNYLIKIYQKPIFTLHINKDLEIPSLDYIDNIYINKSKTKIKGYSVWVYSQNAILFSFFNHFYEHLEEFIKLLPHKNIFFAGLFDAEGNVSLEDGCFRWSCQNENRTKIFIKCLKQMNLFKRYDGANLVSYNLKAFNDLIFPYIKHPKKINNFKLLYHKNGQLDQRFIKILKKINGEPGQNCQNLAKALKRVKLYAQIGFLKQYNYVIAQGYPHKIYLTKKGLATIAKEKK